MKDDYILLHGINIPNAMIQIIFNGPGAVLNKYTFPYLYYYCISIPDKCEIDPIFTQELKNKLCY